MSKYIDADKIKAFLRPDEWKTPDERWRPESEFGAIVDAIPTADVEPVRHGKWKERYYSLPLSDGSRVGYECSRCLTHWDGISNYCPYCGAKMDGRKVHDL